MRRFNCFAGLLCASAATLSAAFIDFDNSPGGPLASGTVLTNQYASLGVTFSALEDGSPINSTVTTIFGIGTNYWANTADDFNNPNRWDELSIVFATPVTGVTWLTQSHGGLSITFNAYDAGNSLLETISVTGSWVPTGFTVGGISRIQALQPLEAWGWGMDDLSFTEETPEPATYALAGMGLAAMALFRRKR